MENKQLELWNKLNEKKTLQEVQNYIKEVIEIRGFANQEIEKTMLLFIEEVGELAKSIRKNAYTSVKDKYSMDICSDNIFRLYESILEER